MNETVRTDEDLEPYFSYEFDTSACGVFTSVQIENIGGKEYITANAKIWKRFPEFCAVIKKRLKDGTLSTSWEISVVKSHFEVANGKKIKVIDEGKFLGHALLGQHVPPAYPESRLLEVAQAKSESDTDLILALNKDIASNKDTIDEDFKIAEENTKVGERELDKEKKVELTEEVVEDTEELVEEETSEEDVVEEEATEEVSALTEYDLRVSLRRAIASKLGEDVSEWDFYIVHHFPADGVVWVQMWDPESELDIIMFTYSVGEDDSVVMSEPIAGKLSVSISQINDTVAAFEAKENELTESLVKANEEIQSLKGEVSSLKPYKEKVEEAEKKRIEEELLAKKEQLKEYAMKSNLIAEKEISENKDIKNAIEQLDKAKINNIIAERFMEKQSDVSEKLDTSNSGKKVEVSEVVKANIEDDRDFKAKHRRFIEDYIG